MMNYERTDSGFMIPISLRLYARPAVIKALYPYREKYMISYELSDDTLDIFFDNINDSPIELEKEVAGILRDLDFQMIRFDTMNSTKEIRELLVARALYTTCIEPDHETIDLENDSSGESWQDDLQGIFSSWTSELAE